MEPWINKLPLNASGLLTTDKERHFPSILNGNSFTCNKVLKTNSCVVKKATIPSLKTMYIASILTTLFLIHILLCSEENAIYGNVI